jgi:AraC-like DNA-binding protein
MPRPRDRRAASKAFWMARLSDVDVLRILRADIQEAGNQSKWARRHGISRPHLNRVLKRKRGFSPRILKALKLKPIWQHSLSKKHIRGLLQEAIDEAGSQSEWCRRVRVDRTWLNKLLNGRVPIGLRIVKLLKIKTMYVQSD